MSPTKSDIPEVERFLTKDCTLKFRMEYRDWINRYLDMDESGRALFDKLMFMFMDKFKNFGMSSAFELVVKLIDFDRKHGICQKRQNLKQ